MIPIQHCVPDIEEPRYASEGHYSPYLGRWKLSEVKVAESWDELMQRALIHNRPVHVMFIHRGEVRAGDAYVLSYDYGSYNLLGTGPLRTMMSGGGPIR